MSQAKKNTEFSKNRTAKNPGHQHTLQLLLTTSLLHLNYLTGFHLYLTAASRYALANIQAEDVAGASLYLLGLMINLALLKALSACTVVHSIAKKLRAMIDIVCHLIHGRASL